MKALAIAGMLGSLFGCQPHTILVQGTGSVERDPDFVSISASVSDSAPTTDAAAAASAKHMNAITEGLKAAGFTQDSIHIFGFKIEEHCAETELPTGKTINKCTGFDASNHISIKLTKLSQAGLLLGTLAKLGVTGTEDPEFGLAEENPAFLAARQQAIENARQTAQAYAKSVGKSLGDVFHVEEEAAGSSFYSRYGDHRGGSPSYDISVAPSNARATIIPLTIEKITTSATVYAEFELK